MLLLFVMKELLFLFLNIFWSFEMFVELKFVSVFVEFFLKNVSSLRIFLSIEFTFVFNLKVFCLWFNVDESTLEN